MKSTYHQRVLLPIVMELPQKLKRLDIGEYLVFSHDRAKNAYSCANRIGIEICTRRISEDKTRVYRVKINGNLSR